VFVEAHQYRTSLFEVVNYGGPSATQTVDRSSDLWRDLIELNARIIEHMGLVRGVTHIEAQGIDFDPNVHQAVIHEPSDEHREGEVMEELQRGYKLGDRLLRPAMVKVAKRS